MILLSDPIVAKGALLSECQTYRYSLQRFINSVPLRWVAWVLNNPSTADSDIDDATVRRVWAFTQSWGYNGMLVANTNPYRATNPRLQRIPPAPVLAYNDGCMLETMSWCNLVVCGWGDGAVPELAKRTALMLHAQGPLHVLRLTKAGNPSHPLYLPGKLQPQPWRPTKWLQ